MCRRRYQLPCALVGAVGILLLGSGLASAARSTAPGATSSAPGSGADVPFALVGGPLLAGPFLQQGPKLVGSGAAGVSAQGFSVALSADGDTALVGSWADNGGAGAAWVFTRSGGVWTQQGAKLVGSGAIGNAQQGYSVALSADGNTALVGGWTDDTGVGGAGVGAVWVFTRSGGVWTQQGPKLVGSGGAGAEQQGASAALSADGNTALIGGPGLMISGVAACWVFTRSGGVWTQQGAKLVGSGADSGSSVALSADGNTALIGGNGDNDSTGAAYVFARSGGAWTQQGAKLVGSGAVGAAMQGSSVALSSDGNTAMIGGPTDDSLAGAIWVFTRSGGVWTQQGAKLVGSGAVGAAQQGGGVALSADGNAALVGGWADNSNAGAAWVFARSGGVWTQQGPKLAGSGAIGNAEQGYGVDLSADGKTALLGGPHDDGTGAAWVFTAPPTVSAVSPSAGPAAGGTAVTITGANLGGASAVNFGSGAATSFTIVSNTQITASTPMQAAGTVDVTVTTSIGTSAMNTADRFTFCDPPGNTALPQILGTPTQGQTLRATPGIWTNEPTSLAYQWQDCDRSGANATSIGGATASSYALRADDVGHTIRVVVTATGVGGSTTASSAATAVVARLPNPTCLALANVTVVQGKKATLRYKVNDPGSASATVTITIRLGKKVAKTITLKGVPTNKAQRYSFRVKLKKGHYTWRVKAKDAAGKLSPYGAAKKLVVK